jgi:hypothetical protein
MSEAYMCEYLLNKKITKDISLVVFCINSHQIVYIYMQIKQIEYFLYLNYIYFKKNILKKIKIIIIFFLSCCKTKMLQNPIYIYTDLVRTCRYSICWNSCLQTCSCSIFFEMNYGLYSICWILTIYILCK